MRPPFEITPHAASQLSEIERLLGRIEGALLSPASPQLRRSSRVKTVRASLEIEGNTLTEEQVTAVLEGKRVVAPARELREVQNAIACYEMLPRWKAGSVTHMLAAHKLMMAGLVKRPGTWRSKGVGIAKGSIVTHVAPPPGRVAGLMRDLLTWVRADTEVPLPIRAAVCHYEIEFIHPFEDGNGRMGRLWHSLILHHHHPVFAQVPVESAIRDRQSDYYRVLGVCDNDGSATAFVEFALDLTLSALQAASSLPQPRMDADARIAEGRRYFGTREFSRKDYLQRFPGLSPATASRDLQRAVERKQITRHGDRATARYRFR